jgi:hypothetical protein
LFSLAIAAGFAAAAMPLTPYLITPFFIIAVISLPASCHAIISPFSLFAFQIFSLRHFAIIFAAG